MSTTILTLIAVQCVLVFVIGLCIGYFIRSKQAASESETSKKTLQLWQTAIGRIDELTSRSAIQLGSVRERLVNLDQTVNDQRFAEPFADLNKHIGILEAEIRSLGAHSEAIRAEWQSPNRSASSRDGLAAASLDKNSTQNDISTHRLEDLLCEIDQHIDGFTPMESLLDFVFDGLRELIPCQRMGFAEIDYESDRVTAAWYRSDKAGRLKTGYSALLSESSLRYVAEKNCPRVLNDLPEYLRRHPSSNSTRLIVSEGFRSSLTLPIASNGTVVAFLFISNTNVDSFDDEMVKVAKKVAKKIGRSTQLPTPSGVGSTAV